MAIDFSTPHPRQIQNAIKWLSRIRDDIQVEIDRLEKIRGRTADNQKFREMRRQLMRDLISKNLTEIEAEKRLIEIGWQNSDRRGSAHILRLVAKRKARLMRNQEIVRRVMVNKERPADVARSYGISPATVSRVLAAHPIA